MVQSIQVVCLSVAAVTVVTSILLAMKGYGKVLPTASIVAISVSAAVYLQVIHYSLSVTVLMILLGVSLVWAAALLVGMYMRTSLFAIDGHEIYVAIDTIIAIVALGVAAFFFIYHMELLAG